MRLSLLGVTGKDIKAPVVLLSRSSFLGYDTPKGNNFLVNRNFQRIFRQMSQITRSNDNVNKNIQRGGVIK